MTLSRSDSDLMAFAACANDYVSLLTDRWDIVVKAGKGLGHGAPACFIPATAEIELDSEECGKADQPRLDRIGWRLASIDMVRPKHRAIVPVTTGALAHECGHSLFTLWPQNPSLAERIAKEPKQVVTLAMAIEEGRQEFRIYQRQPSVKKYLQRTFSSIIMPGMPKVAPDDAFALLHAAALIFPRHFGGWGVETDGYSLVPFIESKLGSGTSDKLIKTLRDGDLYKPCADNDATVLDIARKWWELLPEEAKDKTPNGASGSGCPSHGEKGEDKPGPDALGDAKASAKAYESGAAYGADKAAIEEARESEKAVGGKEAAEKAKTAGKHGFGPSRRGSGVSGRRMPTATESAVAKRVGTILRSAQVVSRAKAPKAVPPGRLRSRAAIEWSRDRAMGRATDVSLWRGKTKSDDIPPLRMGIGLDVSGSMGGLCGLAASLGWTMAASAWDAEALVAGVCFGSTLYPYVEVGKAFSEVKTLAAHDGSEAIGKACHYLDDMVNLTNGDGCRILVIISDCAFVDSGEAAKGAKWAQNFVKSGGNIIFVAREPYHAERYLPGWPLPPKDGIFDVEPDLNKLASAIGSVIRKAYARM